MRQKIFYISLVFLLLCVGCKRQEEPLRWNSDYSLPLAYGSLGIADLLPDSLVNVASDSSIMLVYEGELLNLDLTEILMLPDTVIRDTFQVQFPSPIDLSPGQVFINIPEEQDLQLPQISLSSAKIASGSVEYELESTINGIVTYTYEIPSATDWTGAIFSKTITVPAASTGGTSVVSGTFDLGGYFLDMTGQGGIAFNKVMTNINCKISTSNTSDISVSSADEIIIANKFKDMVIEEAQGYFGQHTVSTGLEYTSFEGFSNWVAGAIDIDDLEVDLVLRNGVGVDAFIQLNELEAVGANSNVSLSHTMIGELISLTRATRYYDSIVPTTYETDLDPSNSNIDNFLEVLPNEVGYNMEVSINPMGNVSGYNDFYNRNAPMGVFINARMPLSFIANELTLEDTLTMTIDASTPVNEMTLFLELENGFPLNADIELGVLDANDKVISRIFSPSLISAAGLGSDGKVDEVASSIHELVLNAVDLERVKTNGRILLTVVFDTPGGNHVALYDSYRLDYKIKADANLTITTSND